MDHNAPEEIEKRATQEDPIVLYIIVRESLGMSVGKIGAQCAHASQIILLNYYDQKENIDGLKAFGWTPSFDGCGFTAETYKIMEDWLRGSFRKVVLTANESEWNKVLAENVGKVIVTDAGLTELAANTDTVIGLYPMRKSERPKIIKRLQALK